MFGFAAPRPEKQRFSAGNDRCWGTLSTSIRCKPQCAARRPRWDEARAVAGFVDLASFRIPQALYCGSAVRRPSQGTPMSLKMPEADQAVLARRAEIVRDLSAIVPGEGVI